jgi:nucleoside 2-deoxyribosyltransferase
VGEKGEKLLAHLARLRPKAGSCLQLTIGNFTPSLRLSSIDRVNEYIKPEFLAFAWVQDIQELLYILEDYLEKEMQFIDFCRGYRVTPKGWAHLQSLQQRNAQSSIGFIAMWFDNTVNIAHLAFHAGIQNAGYEPLRIDKKEHNNKIDDEIVAGIRRSKFLVADFTGHRGGVYFEAGLAMGLGLPVIWLCRKDDLEKTHFDARQYNFIVWDSDNLGELTTALQNRIEATIGRGPVQPAV